MIDIHCHILPGIDDGPKNLDESLAMVRFAVSSGIKRIITTPHIIPGRYENTIDNIKPVFENLVSLIKENNIPIEIGYSAEIRVDPVILDMVTNETLPYLGEFMGDLVFLMELPHSHIPPGCGDLIKWLGDKGIRVIIAHPERNRSVLRNVDALMPFIKSGCLMQITGGSLTGVFSRESENCAVELLKRNWVNIMASDAHNIHSRCPELEPARRKAEKIVGEENANDMVIGLPEKITNMHFDKQ